MKTPLLMVDFKQEKASNQLFSKAPLLTSRLSSWSGIHVEHHKHSHETPEHRLLMHTVAPMLNSVRTENWLDGHYQADLTQPGDFAIYPAHVTHRAVTKVPAEFMIMALEPEFFAGIAEEWTNPSHIQLIPHSPSEQDPLIFQLGLSLKRELESGCLGGRVYGDSAATMLVVHLLRHYSTCNKPIREYTGGLPPYKLKQAIAYIQDHLSEDVSLEAIANEVGISQYYFSRLFKQSLGIPPHRYINQQRIERAKQLLKDPKLAITLRDSFAYRGCCVTVWLL